jgi:GNAT superfamily N-acetyltransferase
MDAEFLSIEGKKPGIITSLLRRSYAELLEVDKRWLHEQVHWDEYDRLVFSNPGTMGACLFLTLFKGNLAGFGSWDPRQYPEYGIVGHNCILPKFRGKGLGRQQTLEILRRLRMLGIRMVKASTIDHPFFIPAQRTYRACGFRELRRIPWDRDPKEILIEYERDMGQ